jgi:hypothetical protein
MIHLFYGTSLLFLIVTSLYATIYGLLYKNRFKEMKFIFIYPAASFVETFIFPTIGYYYPRLSGMQNMVVNIFLIIEFLIIYHYYLQIITNVKAKIILNVVRFLYVSSMILIWSITNTFTEDPEIFFFPQAILILVPGFYYFIEIIKGSYKTDLKSEPTFWIMIGIILYFGCTLPLFLLVNILDFYELWQRSVYSINCVCYGLLYLLMIKAFLCKKREAL